METVVERPVALDVHKEQVTACVRVPGKGRSREQQVAEFPTTVAGLLTLRDWLAASGIDGVTRLSTQVEVDFYGCATDGSGRGCERM